MSRIMRKPTICICENKDAFFMFCSSQCTCLHVPWVKAQQECIFIFGYLVCLRLYFPVKNYSAMSAKWMLKGGGGANVLPLFLEGANIHHYAFVEGAIILPCQLLGVQMSTHAIFHRGQMSGGGGGGKMSGSHCFTLEIHMSWHYMRRKMYMYDEFVIKYHFGSVLFNVHATTFLWIFVSCRTADGPFVTSGWSSFLIVVN